MKRLLALLTISAATCLSAHAQTQAGLTFRLYDIGAAMDKLYPLSGSPTPNLHEIRPTIDYTGPFSNPIYSETYTNYYLIELSGEINTASAGSYNFRLTSDDGSILSVDGTELINHDGLRAVSPPGTGSRSLTAGWHPFLLRYFQNAVAGSLKLEWQQPGDANFSVVPQSAFRTEVAVLVASPGKKAIVRPGSRPGNGQPLLAPHPQWQLADISLGGFEPKVGDIAFLPNGDLLVATFEPNRLNSDITTYNAHTRLYRVTNPGGDPANVTTTHVAGDGLAGSFSMTECTGMACVGGEVYVALRENIYRVRDTNGDGIYDQKTPLLTTNLGYHNFHQFNFSLTPVNEGGTDYLYGTISTAVEMSGAAKANMSDYNGSLFGFAIPAEGSTTEPEFLAGGLRTPNGVSIGPEGRIFVADNQGSWNPANSLTEIRPGRFYGHHNPTNFSDGVQGVAGRFENQPLSPKSFLLPQGTLSNSPTEGVMLDSGPYAGQMILGELTAGGLHRVFFDKVQGEYQGAVFHHSQGFEAGINRVIKGPDGALYLGCMGSGGNWSWQGKLTGLQRLSPIPGAAPVFEMKAVRAIPGGLEVEFTESVPASFLTNVTNYTMKQWTYAPTSNYGGSNIDEQVVVPTSAVASADRKRVQLYLPGLKEGYCVYLKTDPVSDNNEQMWTTEAWYTLNHKLPSAGVSTTSLSERVEAESGVFANGPKVATNHAGFTGSGFVDGTDTAAVETITLTFNSPAAGTFPVTLRYARGSASGSGTLTTAGSFDISANGGATATFSLPLTPDWDTWQTSAPVNLTLVKGINTIVLRNPYGNNGICNIDRIDLNVTTGSTHPPATLNLERNTIPPGLPAGTPITGLNATDPDGGPLTFELAFNSLDFDVLNGKLCVKHGLAVGSYPVAVRVIDATGLYKESSFTITVEHGPDADADGMDDRWEQIFGLDPALKDAAIDADGDGRTNLEEYLALTDPHNCNDALNVADWSRGAGEPWFRLMSRLSRSYQLKRSIDLRLETWQNVGPAVPGTDRMIELFDVTASSGSPRAFYRVEVTL